jgi:hypothetical protein
MKKIVFDSFKSTLKEVQFLNTIIKNEKVKKEELQKGLTKARDLLFSSYSSLNIFDEAVKNYVSVGYKIKLFERLEKRKISKTEAKVIYSKLINIINSEIEEGLINPRTKIHLKNEILFLGLTLYSAKVNEELIEFNKSLEILKINKTETENTLLKYYKEIIRFIEDILLYDIFLIFDKPEVTYASKIIFNGTRDYKKEYIQKWLDCTVELSDINENKRIDHWEEIFKLDLDFDIQEKIDQHQKKLFYEQIQYKVESEIDDINELSSENKIELIINHKELIEGFFKGDTSKTTTKRLNNILNFSKTKEVLLEYDNLIRDRLQLNDFSIYEKKSRTNTKTFVAGFFMKYLESLKEILETEDKANKEKNDNQELAINPMLDEYFQNHDKKEVLLVEELEKRLAIEAAEYKKNCDDYWETYKFDPNYFDTYVSGSLYNEFLKSVYEKIKPLNDFEINKYLTLSVNQFKTHTPIKRAEAFKEIYHDTYWHPNYMVYDKNQYENKYPVHVWKHYSNHFNLFKEATEIVLHDFKNGLIGNGKNQEVILKPKTKIKSKHYSFTYKNNFDAHTNLTNLMKSLKQKKLIADDTELAVFRKAFSGNIIEKPIIWIGNISELSYFIKQLHNVLKYVEDLKQEQWAVTIGCFIQEDGELYNRTKLRTQKIPATSKIIDKALKNLK